MTSRIAFFEIYYSRNVWILAIEFHELQSVPNRRDMIWFEIDFDLSSFEVPGLHSVQLMQITQV